MKCKLSRKGNENMACVKNSKNSRINGHSIQQDFKTVGDKTLEELH